MKLEDVMLSEIHPSYKRTNTVMTPLRAVPRTDKLTETGKQNGAYQKPVIAFVFALLLGLRDLVSQPVTEPRPRQ